MRCGRRREPAVQQAGQPAFRLVLRVGDSRAAHFWGPVSNAGIVFAVSGRWGRRLAWTSRCIGESTAAGLCATTLLQAIADTQKPPDIISEKFTAGACGLPRRRLTGVWL